MEIVDLPPPLLLANQSDRLGSRLCAIVNAWSLAKALHLRFGFVWPRNVCRELQNPLEIFSQDFLDEFEVPEASFQQEKNSPVLGVMTLEETKSFCLGHQDKIIVVPLNFEIHAFVGEQFKAAHERFRQSFAEIGWSEVVRQIIAIEKGRIYDALHVRAGDIILGDWKQSLPVEKYLPTGFVEYFIQISVEKPGSLLVIFSDNAEYVSYLVSRFQRACTVVDLVPGYQNLSEAQQAFVDIYMLSGASRLFAPVRSAFSRLASSLGGTKVQSVDEFLGSEEAFLVLRSHLNDALSQDRQPPFKMLLARDICWLLDVFSDRLTPDERLAFARQAVACDPSFCIARTRLAFSLLQLGYVDAAELEVENARKIAEEVLLYHDPMVDALACLICVIMYRFSMSCSGHAALDGIDQLQKAEAALTICEELYPAMIYKDDLFHALYFIVQSMRWLVRQNEPLKDSFLHGFHSDCSSFSETLKWRRDGFAILHALAASFPGLLRHVEEVSFNVSSAIGRVLASEPSRQLGRPLRCGFERVYCSQSGLEWALGWAYPWQQGADLMIGLIRKDMPIQGGILSNHLFFAATHPSNLSGSPLPRFAIPMARGESHSLTIVVAGTGGWKQRLHNFISHFAKAVKA